ncbi:NifB/NifX family molybdenum-iron cluster-binding protein [bacterium]|nr:NifB/NifX family molybdenum-iron cluster-binding protein [bacterium]
MKIAVSATGSTPDSEVDPRFGRAPWFIVLDTETGEFTSIDNSESVAAASGAGVQAVSRVTQAGVTRVITGQCGPKSAQGLKAAGVEVVTGASGTARDALMASK